MHQVLILKEHFASNFNGWCSIYFTTAFHWSVFTDIGNRRRPDGFVDITCCLAVHDASDANLYAGSTDDNIH